MHLQKYEDSFIAMNTSEVVGLLPIILLYGSVYIMQSNRNLYLLTKYFRRIKIYL